jgi:hypothetical protein
MYPLTLLLIPLEGMIDPAQLIKVATRVNYDLGLRIHRTKQVVLDVEHNKARLPHDFAYLNYAFICGEYLIRTKNAIRYTCRACICRLCS